MKNSLRLPAFLLLLASFALGCTPKAPTNAATERSKPTPEKSSSSASSNVTNSAMTPGGNVTNSAMTPSGNVTNSAMTPSGNVTSGADTP